MPAEIAAKAERVATASQPLLPVSNPEEKEKASAIDLDRLSGASRQRAASLLDIYTTAKQVIRLQLLDDLRGDLPALEVIFSTV